MKGSKEKGPAREPPVMGSWQRALQAAGGVRPLVFGQYGEFGGGLQTLLDELALAAAARRP